VAARRGFGYWNDMRLLLMATLVSWIGVADAAPSARDVDALAKASYIYVATVRKDGTQSKAVPVWFIKTPEDQMLVDAGPDSWKAKRLRRGSPVLVWIESRTGPAFIGTAELVKDRAVEDTMIEEIPKKYLIAWIGFFGPKRARFDAGKTVVVRITHARDLPEGFESQPGKAAPGLDPP
jgi:Pyridoxamine 5'-phosphate oxidase